MTFWEGCYGKNTCWARRDRPGFRVTSEPWDCGQVIWHLSLLIHGLKSAQPVPDSYLACDSVELTLQIRQAPLKCQGRCWWWQLGHSHLGTRAKGQCESGSFMARHKLGRGCMGEPVILVYPSPTMIPPRVRSFKMLLWTSLGNAVTTFLSQKFTMHAAEKSCSSETC